MKLSRRLAALLAALLAVSTAVAYSDPTPAAAPPPSADLAPALGQDEDGGADAAQASARLSAPRIVSAGGPVLTAPRLVVVTFGDEPFAAELETFAKSIGTSDYWKDTTSEYGVGPATFARSVRILVIASCGEIATGS